MIETIATGYQDMIVRWKKATMALWKPDQKYGQALVDELQRHSGREIAMFSDPVEAVLYFALIRILKEMEAAGIPIVRSSEADGQTRLV